jgi:hypothetical protein
MDYKYNKNSLIQGERYRREKEENPSTFALYNGEVNPLDSDNLQSSSSARKAGQVGQRALELMNNPEAAQRTDEWMNQFGQSNEGAEFNRSKQAEADAFAMNQRLS